MKYLLLSTCLFLIIASCKKKDEEGCTETAGSTIASAQEEKEVTDYLAANNITNAIELENSGMYYIIVAAGNSKKPEQCSTVRAKYTGRFKDGKIFDQTTGDNTATFSLKTDQFGNELIQGWKRALPLIGEGGIMKLYIPASLAYGEKGQVNPRTGAIIIPPNSMLIFDIELISIIN